MGSYNWMAPEMRDGSTITKVADMFSFGCALYWALSGGKHPFGDESIEANILMNKQTDLAELEDPNCQKSDYEAYRQGPNTTTQTSPNSW